MNACLYIMAINALMPVYAHKGDAVQVDSVSVGDSVCVTRIEDGWQQIHWSISNINYTGWLQGVTVKQNAQPTEPAAREYEYDVPQPAPQLPEPQISPPTRQNHSRYERGPAPMPMTRPASLVMQCFPQGGAPYSVVYVNGRAAVISQSGTTREYSVFDEHDNQGGYTFYVAAKRGDQDRTLYFAFDYSQRTDVSAIRVKAPGGYDSRDKCAMDWKDTK